MSAGPYGIAAQDYFDNGWSPITLPSRSKWPVPDDFTGAKGVYVDAKQLKTWISSRGKASAGKLSWLSAGGNIALRLPDTVIGIDVDMYDGKAGRETFNKAIDEWGELPPTWMTSSRADGSGIRLYRIPSGLAWPGKLPQGGGVELVRWDHRYAICAPSIHDKTGDEYGWFKFGEYIEDEIPSVDELPDLPQAWIDGLTGGKRWVERESADLSDAEVREWLAARNDGKPCTQLRRTLTTYSRRVRVAGDEGGAHDQARDGAWALIGDAQLGHAGIVAALAKLKKVFVTAVAPRRGHDGERLAAEEWARIVVRGVQKVAAEGEPDVEDMCAALGSGSQGSGASAGSGVGDGGGGDGADDDDSDDGGAERRVGRLWDFSRDDIGNAQRLVYAHRHEMRWCDALGGWQVWNGHRWHLDGDGTVTRWAQDIVRDMETMASEIDDPKEKSAFLKFVRSCGNIGKLDAMIKLASRQHGMVTGAEEFDSDALQLGTLNGTVRLGSSVERVPAQPEHRITMLAGAAYRADAAHALWDKFIERSQPDEEIRLWLQKLCGYTLLGGNPHRLFIVAHGPTSTGKTTFAEAMRAALGAYGGTMNLTVFRDNQDERARADIVEALGKRFLYAEEASQSWHLHPDQIKRVTGGSAIRARLPFAKAYVERIPAFTPWLLTNHAPTIEGADAALMKRLLVVPFDVPIDDAEEVAEYREQLAAEGKEAVLAWCLRGWELYRASGDLSTPPNAYAVREAFRIGLSNFDLMLGEICEFDAAYREKPIAILNAYKRWCDVANIQSKDKLNHIEFGRNLEARGHKLTSKRVDGKPIPCRRGLRLREEYASIVPEAFARD